MGSGRDPVPGRRFVHMRLNLDSREIPLMVEEDLIDASRTPEPSLQAPQLLRDDDGWLWPLPILFALNRRHRAGVVPALAPVPLVRGISGVLAAVVAAELLALRGLAPAPRVLTVHACLPLQSGSLQIVLVSRARCMPLARCVNLARTS
jgi:hypothetical protein